MFIELTLLSELEQEMNHMNQYLIFYQKLKIDYLK